MSDSEWIFRTCQYFKTTMFILCRYPVFPTQYIRDHIDLPDTKPRELQDYKDNSVTAHRFRALLLVSVYIFYTIKNGYVLYAWLDSFDHENYKGNIGTLNYDEQQLIQMNYSLPSDTLKHISCLYTNCTRLGPAESYSESQKSPSSAISMELLRDFGRIPTLALCHPMLEAVYSTPVTKIGTFGIFCFLVSMYTHMLLGYWTTVLQILLPSTSDLLMTITSPEVTRRKVRVQTCALLHDLALSLRNFRLFSISSQTNDREASQPMFAVMDQYQSAGAAKGSNYLPDFRNGCRWRPSYTRRMQVVSAPLRDSDEIESSNVESSQRNLLVDSTLNNLYFRGRSEQDISRVIDNCTPVVCSEWWRSHLARILASMLVVQLLLCILLTFCILSYVSRRISIEGAVVREFARQMERQNCFIWLETASSFTPDQATSIDQINYRWSIFSFLDAAVLNFISGMTGLILFIYYWLMITHIRLWLAEMRMFIMASLLATRFQHEHDRREVEHDLCDKVNEGRRDPDRPSGCIPRGHFISTRNFYNIPNLRQQFKESIRVFHVYTFKMIRRCNESTYNTSASSTEKSTQKQVFDFRLLNSKHSDRNYADRFLKEILLPPTINHDDAQKSSHLVDRIDFDTESMEQIYVNFRLLVSYVRNLSSAMRMFMTNTYLLNYGYILASIICRRKFSDLNQETIFMSVVAFIITNYVIFLSADFHANAKQLQPLLWSLIAQLTYSKNIRVQHLRSLWIKQTVNLDNHGGLALIAYGVPITYVYIIQLAIWTATIFVLALKPHGQDG